MLDSAGLQDNGGPTETIALETRSPASGEGSNPLSLTTDQRGFGPRTGMGGTDVGAYQTDASAPMEFMSANNASSSPKRDIVPDQLSPASAQSLASTQPKTYLFLTLPKSETIAVSWPEGGLSLVRDFLLPWPPAPVTISSVTQNRSSHRNAKRRSLPTG